MRLKQFFLLLKIWVLLLCFSTLAVAKDAIPIEQPQTAQEELLFKSGSSLHKDLLQPQNHSTARIQLEQAAKWLPYSFAVVPNETSILFRLDYVGLTPLVLQDVDRCESVSQLLFPHHIFW